MKLRDEELCDDSSAPDIRVFNATTIRCVELVARVGRRTVLKTIGSEIRKRRENLADLYVNWG
jgi:hypothetical protein